MTSVNPNAQKEVLNVLNFFEENKCKKVVLGQHTMTMAQEELAYIKKVTGELPAICGFELLAYSPNIKPETCSQDCLNEISEAKGTLKKAWDWAKKGGLITFTWHWHSPLGGIDRSFYSRNTEFNVEKAVTPGTPEYNALIGDIDYMAGILKPFCDEHIPILWRPFHESDGTWFWWGKCGHEAFEKLYRLMFIRYTKRHHLDNLIWVYSGANPDRYPGDEVVDILTSDLYPPAHVHTGCSGRLKVLKPATKVPEKKLYAIGQIGSLPDVRQIINTGIEWSYYVARSKGFAIGESCTTKEFLRQTYQYENSVTLSRLPKLY